MKLCSFAKVAYSLPIANKRKRGQPSKTASALLRKPNEQQPDIGVDETPSIEEPEPAMNEPKSKKSRGAPRLIRQSNRLKKN